MSCNKCDEFQVSDKTSFYRWKHSNVEIRGCSEHLVEIFDVLFEFQNRDTIEQETTNPPQEQDDGKETGGNQREGCAGETETSEGAG